MLLSLTSRHESRRRRKQISDVIIVSESDTEAKQYWNTRMLSFNLFEIRLIIPLLFIITQTIALSKNRL